MQDNLDLKARATSDHYHHFHGHSQATPRPLRLVRLIGHCELELELIQTQMTQKPVLRAEMFACAMRTTQKRKYFYIGISCFEVFVCLFVCWPFDLLPQAPSLQGPEL